MNTFNRSLITAIDAKIEEKSLLKHPFYQEWTKGTLTEEALQDYAAQYYHHVHAFPTYLSSLHAQTDSLNVRKHILQNLIDEEGSDPTHPALWLTFANHLGINEEEVLNVEMLKETEALINEFRELCGTKGTLAGLSALYAYESQIPAVSETKIDGLKKFYGFVDPDGYSYFSVHIEADKEHSAVERELLDRLMDEESEGLVFESIDRALDAIWEMLSGICRRHNISC